MYFEIVFVAVTIFAAALLIGGWSLLFLFWRVFDEGNEIDPIYSKPDDPLAKGSLMKPVEGVPNPPGLSGKAAA